MKKISILAFAVACATSHAQLSYSDFSSTAGLTLNGDAAQVGSAVRLTPLGMGHAGTVWANAQQDVGDGFHTDFTGRAFDGTSGDGICFGIQNNAATALGIGGGSNAIEGIPNAVGVTFRSFWDDCYLFTTDNGGNTTIIKSVALNTVHADAGYTAAIDYNGATKDWTVTFNGVQLFTSNLDLGAAISLTAGTNSYVGFGAGTGLADDNNDLKSWNFNSNAVPEPATITALGMALLAGVTKRRRK